MKLANPYNLEKERLLTFVANMARMKLKQLLLMFFSIMSLSVYAHPADTTTPPYKKYPTLPAFNILLMDSATTFNTFNIEEGRYTMLMFFSTDCDHCQMMTDTLKKSMHDLRNVQICMVAPQTISEIRAFYNRNDMKRYRNVMMGKDIDMFFHKFYQAYYVPDIVIYDKHKKLVKFFEGGAHMKDILAALQD